jgi:hypothetical protein
VVHTDAQAEMAVRGPSQVQLERIGELGRVVVGGLVADVDLLVAADQRPAQLDVLDRIG